MTDRESLKTVSVKYGIVLIVFFLNTTLSSVLFGYAVSLLRESGIITQGTDLYYLVIILCNELAVYLVPLAAFRLIFAGELEDSAPLKRYERLNGENGLILLAGLAVSAAGAFISQLIMSVIAALTGTSAPKIAFSSAMPKNLFQFFVFLICVTVIAPVCEEIIFRHLLLVPLRRYGDFTAALVSSVMFSLFHLNLTQLVYTMAFGFFLSAAAVRSDSLKAPVIIHVFNNAAVCMISYFPEELRTGAVLVFIDILSFVTVVLQVMGIGVFFILLRKKLLVLKNTSELSVGEQLLVMIRTPAVIAGLILVLLLYFVK